MIAAEKKDNRNVNEHAKKAPRYDTGKETIDNFGKAQIGKSVTITLRSGRV
jgi:hypothetical protein